MRMDQRTLEQPEVSQIRMSGMILEPSTWLSMCWNLKDIGTRKGVPKTLHWPTYRLIIGV